jgi:hypothetical protein
MLVCDALQLEEAAQRVMAPALQGPACAQAEGVEVVPSGSYLTRRKPAPPGELAQVGVMSTYTWISSGCLPHGAAVLSSLTVGFYAE